MFGDMFDRQSILQSIQTRLCELFGDCDDLKWIRNLSGGDINEAALLGNGDTRWFLKYHQGSCREMFAVEALALEEISASGCIRVPRPITLGSDGTTAWLLLEYIELTQSGPSSTLGEQLAAMHHISKQCFGWQHDNFIGTTAQLNTETQDWSDFWRDYRLQPQLVLAESGGFTHSYLEKGERLMASLGHLMDGRQPTASLLHGDLWAGNKAFTTHGQPVIYDPASYYGDRETDIAMTQLFGGFDASFYAAYEAHFPLNDGYELRRELYNLYHMLNHFNLFGGAYLNRCERMIDRLLAEIR